MNPLVLAAVMAIGQSPDGSDGSLFLEFSGGVNWYEDVLDVSIDSGGFMSFGVGMEWDLNSTLKISVEGEYSYHDGDAQGSFKACEGKSCLPSIAFDGDLESHAFMVNVLLTQALFSDDHDGFFVYGGLGVGISHNSGEVTFTYKEYSQTFKASGNELAWQALFGVGWRFDDRWAVKTGGRYFDGGSVVDDLGIDAESFVWELGFSYSF